MKRVLVIGKKSFVGTSFVEYIRTNFSECYAVEIVSSRNDEWKKYDFGKYDAVLNVAGLAHVRAKKEMEGQYYAVNRDMPIEMGIKARNEGCKQFIHMSSEIVYGGMSVVGETNVINWATKESPENFYGNSKLQADRELERLNSKEFCVALIRSPLIYSEKVKDGNFPLLIKVARKTPIFPTIENRQSMIYIYNLAELIRLIIENKGCGYFYPQNKEYSCTSKLVKDFANGFGRKIWMIGIFNPIIKVLSRYCSILKRAFGEMVYDKNMSNHYDWKYCIYSYEKSIQEIIQEIKKSEH